jgi:hypothetical protein
MNPVGFILCMNYYRDWVKAFFDRSRAGPCNLGIVSPPLYNFLSRQSTAISMTFTYDMAITFHADGVPTSGLDAWQSGGHAMAAIYDALRSQ